MNHTTADACRRLQHSVMWRGHTEVIIYSFIGTTRCRVRDAVGKINCYWDKEVNISELECDHMMRSEEYLARFMEAYPDDAQ